MNEKEKYFLEIKNIEKKYLKILEKYDPKFIQIKNLEEERKKFFEEIKKGNIYNPQFKFYSKEFNVDIPIKLKELYREINIKNDYYGLKKLYKERIKTKIFEFYTHYYWGNEKSTNYVLKYRGKPSLKVLFKAKKYCKNYKRQKIRFKKISLDKFKKEIKNFVYYLTKEEIKFKENRNLISIANLNPAIKIFSINPEIKIRNLDLERLKVHEIGTHYLRYYNGQRTGIKILASGTSNYIEIEEGLAAYMEKITGVQSKAQVFIYSGRVIATHYALKKSFYGVFKILKKYGFKDKDAFAITLRAKRNLSDTSKKGGFTKDHVYFTGYLKVKKYHKKGGDLNDLFVGKIKIEDLKVLKNYLNEFKKKPITIFNLYKIKTKLK